MSKSIGHIMAMSLDITQPTKFEIPKMEFNQLTIFVGKNGSGKSMILKLNWCFSMIANYFASGRLLNMTIDYKQQFQFIMDKSFDDQNFDGKIEAFFENATITAEFKDGKIISVTCDSEEGVRPNKFPVFMSANTRLFSSFVAYMQVKKGLGITNTFQMFTEPELLKLTNIYKLYDLLFIEQMLIGMNGYTLDADMKKAFNEQFEMKVVIDQIIVDQDECELYALNLTTLEKVKLTRLSAGEQSILNMLLAPKII